MAKYKNISARPITIKSTKGKTLLIPNAVQDLENTKEVKEYIDILVKEGDLIVSPSNAKVTKSLLDEPKKDK